MCVVVNGIGDFDRASKEMFGLREFSKSPKSVGNKSLLHPVQIRLESVVGGVRNICRKVSGPLEDRLEMIYRGRASSMYRGVAPGGRP